MRFLATPTPPQAFRELTARERENLTLIAQGHNNANIADRQVLSPITVQQCLEYLRPRPGDRGRQGSLA